ncbi:uncharacterized protein [Solanum tuberosum]|uniref:uncharacterized protein isoform X1 n=1 Tax=Solanum tuberosum TaxID=4113 RepID=UPI00073A32B3|nr:PREDICTED: uncharacterized protein LOC102604549 isoform X1 [Solanum tuberosum]
MAEVENHSSPPSDPAPSDPSTPHPQNGFNPSRMIGIIRRKAMIKDLAAIYHAECLAYCQELLELQKKAEESIYLIRLISTVNLSCVDSSFSMPLPVIN